MSLIVQKVILSQSNHKVQKVIHLRYLWVISLLPLLWGMCACSSNTQKSKEKDADVREMISSTHNGHDCIDLGLPSGTLWATCNVGASSPEEYGDYFAWGETKPKEIYDRGNYFDSNDGCRTFNKYNNHGGKDELDASDDAATFKWGDGWCMPNNDQWEELLDKCTWTRTQKNGIDGYEVKSKTNDRSLFLPAAGYRDDGDLYGTGSHGYYWSRSLGYDDSDFAYYLYFASDIVHWQGDSWRCHGFSVRPVRVFSQN